MCFLEDETRDADERGAGVNRLREANEDGVVGVLQDEREGDELKDLSAIGVVTERDESDGDVESVLEGLRVGASVALWLGWRKEEEEGVEGIEAAIDTVTVEGCEGEGTKRDNCFALRVFLVIGDGCNEKACVCEGFSVEDDIDESKEDVVGVWDPLRDMYKFCCMCMCINCCWRVRKGWDGQARSRGQ